MAGMGKSASHKGSKGGARVKDPGGATEKKMRKGKKK
jgi:hypothetical protein